MNLSSFWTKIFLNNLDRRSSGNCDLCWVTFLNKVINVRPKFWWQDILFFFFRIIACVYIIICGFQRMCNKSVKYLTGINIYYFRIVLYTQEFSLRFEITETLKIYKENAHTTGKFLKFLITPRLRFCGLSQSYQRIIPILRSSSQPGLPTLWYRGYNTPSRSDQQLNPTQHTTSTEKNKLTFVRSVGNIIYSEIYYGRRKKTQY